MVQRNETRRDVAATLEEIRQSVRQQQGRLDSLSAAAYGLGATQRDPRFVELSGAVRQLNELWNVSAHLPITWTRPGIGVALAFIKKVVRYLLRWYINPIVEQQNNYNAAAARTADQIVETLEWLALKHAALEARIAALEARTPDSSLNRPSDGREIVGGVSNSDATANPVDGVSNFDAPADPNA